MSKRLINHLLDEIAVARSGERAAKIEADKARGEMNRTVNELRDLMEKRGCPWPSGQTLVNAVVEMLDKSFEQGQQAERLKAKSSASVQS